MNSKLLSFLCAVICFFITLQYAAGQDKSNSWPPQKWPHNPKNCHHLLSNSFQCNWQFFEIKGTIEGTIITYNTSKGDKEGISAVSIIKTGKDTIRVIFLGN